jgi:serine/threonine protein phosphatase PrpC
MKTNYQLNIGAREEQQDSCTILENKHSTFLILADGMGGHDGGTIASKTLVDEASKLYKHQNEIINNVEVFFQEIVSNTIKSLKQQLELNNKIDPHTTCIFALVQNNILYHGHIGDSRLYLFEDKEFIKRTRDHSVPQMLLNMEEITEEEMAAHPDQNKLFRSIGTKKDVKVAFGQRALKNNVVVLICSDGFWEYISTDEMIKYLYTKPLNKAHKIMIDLALKRGGSGGDNISVATCINNSDQKEKAIIKTMKKLLVFVVLIFIIGLLFYNTFLKNDNNIIKDTNISSTNKININDKKNSVKISTDQLDNNTSIRKEGK